MCCQLGLLVGQQGPECTHLNVSTIEVGGVGAGVQHLGWWGWMVLCRLGCRSVRGLGEVVVQVAIRER